MSNSFRKMTLFCSSSFTIQVFFQKLISFIFSEMVFFFPLSASNKLLQITPHCSFYCSDKSLKQHLKILESVDSRSLTFGIEIRTEKSLKAATILNTREEKKIK